MQQLTKGSRKQQEINVTADDLCIVSISYVYQMPLLLWLVFKPNFQKQDKVLNSQGESKMNDMKLKTICKIFFILYFISYAKALTLNFSHHQRHHQSRPQHQAQPNHQKSQNSHDYYNLEETRRVSASRSIKYLDQCKELCLEMHQLFPFEFKYHRLVYRQQQGDMKYVIGQCLYTFRAKAEENKSSEEKEQNKKAQQAHKNQNSPNNNQKWYPWKNLQQFIQMQLIQDNTSKQQKKAWQSYSKDCEDDSLKLSESSRIDFKLTMVHSDFQYYQNQGFNNVHPFDDFDALLGGLGL